MEQFIRVEGVAVPLLRANIDTDLIVPSREINDPGRTGYGEKLLAPWRYLAMVDGQRVENPDFILNQHPFRDATILITGANFGSGSSREVAVLAVRQFGFRCVIAPSFGAIFRNNCYRNGVLPVVLDAVAVTDLAREAQGGRLRLVIDLERCEVVCPDGRCLDFEVPAAEREMLLEGLDAIGLTLRQRARIEAFQQKDQLRRPWIWEQHRNL